jgi:hypothetical protein
MASVLVELPGNEYERLQKEAERLGKSPQNLIQEWVVERLETETPKPLTERERAREALRKAGLLTELGPTLLARANASTATLEEVQAALGRVPHPSLSEIVIQQREPYSDPPCLLFGSKFYTCAYKQAPNDNFHQVLL